MKLLTTTRLGRTNESETTGHSHSSRAMPVGTVSDRDRPGGPRPGRSRPRAKSGTGRFVRTGTGTGIAGVTQRGARPDSGPESAGQDRQVMPVGVGFVAPGGRASRAAGRPLSLASHASAPSKSESLNTRRSAQRGVLPAGSAGPPGGGGGGHRAGPMRKLTMYPQATARSGHLLQAPVTEAQRCMCTETRPDVRWGPLSRR
jgi:hypothetical protein